MNNPIDTLKKMAGLTVAVMMLGTTLSAAAKSDDLGVTTTQMHVRFKDSELKTQEGVGTLYRHIRIAAGEACGGYNAAQQGASGGYAACRDAAIAKAVAKIDNPQLTAQYMARVKDANELLAKAR